MFTYLSLYKHLKYPVAKYCILFILRLDTSIDNNYFMRGANICKYYFVHGVHLRNDEMKTINICPSIT